MNEADWRDVTPMTPGFEFEVQQHRETGKARHRKLRLALLETNPADCYEPAGPWLPGWPGRGLQW